MQFLNSELFPSVSCLLYALSAKLLTRSKNCDLARESSDGKCGEALEHQNNINNNNDDDNGDDKVYVCSSSSRLRSRARKLTRSPISNVARTAHSSTIHAHKSLGASSKASSSYPRRKNTCGCSNILETVRRTRQKFAPIRARILQSCIAVRME